MSDGKEVKRWWTNHMTMESSYESATHTWPKAEWADLVSYVSGDDHDRIVADRDAKIVRMTSDIVDCDRRIAELRAEVGRYKSSQIVNAIKSGQYYGDALDEIANLNQTIVRQARAAEVSKAVIEIAKRVLYNAGLRPPDGGTPTVETICEDLNDAIKEITAIERAEGK